MNIVLIGAGSIGRRHLNNLITIGYQNVTVVSRSNKSIPEYPGIKFKAISALSTEGYDAAIICSPTSSHVEYVRILMHSGLSRIYLEKPVGNNYTEALELEQEIDAKNIQIRVGYDMRYDPGLQKVKELIATGKIGKIISANAFVGQYLPDWRPSQDYKKSMSASVAAGGGVLLDLAHEFDYLYWLLGDAETVACNYNNTSTLGIETEEVAEVLLRFKNGAIGTIHLDYFQPQLVRNCRITGSKGVIYWDLVTREVSVVNYSKEEIIFDYKDFERNDRFLHIMKDFLEGIEDERTVDYKEGLESLKMIEAAKYSSNKNVFVKLDAFEV